jgi:hypothetical protein
MQWLFAVQHAQHVADYGHTDTRVGLDRTPPIWGVATKLGKPTRGLSGAGGS